VADHPLITSQLQTLVSRLPPPLFAEIADGLQETYQTQLIRQPDSQRAAQAAVAQFGDADTITHALCHQAPWRRHAAALLATGPLLGGIWATTLITQQAWLWSLPWIARGLFAAALILVVVLLTLALLEQHTYRRGRRRVLLAASALIGLDALACATVLGHATITSWVVPLALTVSGLRIIAAGFVGARQLRT
jgi:predicted neutral ceramidase superfamily lipid hydrolase